MERGWVALGAFLGLIAVGMAAAAAHGMEAIGPVRMSMLRNAVQMQGWHALALVAVGLWASRGGALADAAGVVFAIGSVLFCGAIYALAIGQWRIGALAPLGGSLLMLGWLLLGISALRAR